MASMKARDEVIGEGDTDDEIAEFIESLEDEDEDSDRTAPMEVDSDSE